MAKQEKIPDVAAQKAVEELRRALAKGGRPDLASSLLIEAKRAYLYVATEDRNPLCRLRRTEKPGFWNLQMFKWSTERYDTENDFMFWGGTLEQCIGAAIEGYHL